MNRRTVLLLCVAIGALAIGVMFTRTSDEERIKKTLSELAAAVAVADGDTLLSRGARIKGGLKDLVDDDVRVNVPELSVDVRGRPRLEEDAMRVGVLYRNATCEWSSVSVKVDPDGTVATADAVAIVTATSGGERRADRRDVHFLLRRDGTWKITTIDVAPKTGTP